MGLTSEQDTASTQTIRLTGQALGQRQAEIAIRDRFVDRAGQKKATTS